MSETIIIVLQGGLGNQLFQYCAGLALASRLGGQLWLTPTQENKHSGRDYRQTLYTRAKALGPDGQPPIPRLNQQAGAFDPWDPIQFQGDAAIALKGYYQFLPPIELYISKIRSDLDERPIRTSLLQKYKIIPKETCFLHVRRGDYLTQKPGTFWIQDES